MVRLRIIFVGESKMGDGCGFVFRPTLRTTWVYELINSAEGEGAE